MADSVVTVPSPSLNRIVGSAAGTAAGQPILIEDERRCIGSRPLVPDARRQRPVTASRDGQHGNGQRMMRRHRFEQQS